MRWWARLWCTALMACSAPASKRRRRSARVARVALIALLAVLQGALATAAPAQQAIEVQFSRAWQQAEQLAAQRQRHDWVAAVEQQVVEPLLAAWSLPALAEQLLGREQLAALSPAQRSELLAMLGTTVARYVFEVVERLAAGATLTGVQVALGEVDGTLTAGVSPRWWWDTDVVFYLQRREASWQIANLQVGPINYVAAKQRRYRQLFVDGVLQPQRWARLLAERHKKNARYFTQLCELGDNSARLCQG